MVRPKLEFAYKYGGNDDTFHIKQPFYNIEAGIDNYL